MAFREVNILKVVVIFWLAAFLVSCENSRSAGKLSGNDSLAVADDDVEVDTDLGKEKSENSFDDEITTDSEGDYIGKDSDTEISSDSSEVKNDADDKQLNDEDNPLRDVCEGVTCSGRGFCYNDQGIATCQCNSGYHSVDDVYCVKDDEIVHDKDSGSNTDREVADEDNPVQDVCSGIACGGHGHCSAEMENPVCKCDEWYVVDGLNCIPSCGNNNIESFEVCEKGDKTACSQFGYDEGTATCKNDCSSFDKSECKNIECNDQCSYVGEKRCNDNNVESCKADAEGCLVWRLYENCYSDEICVVEDDVYKCIEDNRPKTEIMGTTREQFETVGYYYLANVYKITKKRTLTDFAAYLKPDVFFRAYFIIYKADKETGPYNKIHQREVGFAPSDNPNFYSASSVDTLSINLEVGKYYMIGTYWDKQDEDGEMTYYYTKDYWESGLVKTTAFGDWVGGYSLRKQEIPPEELEGNYSGEINPDSSMYYQMLSSE